ncbi:MAG TPA: thiamine-phosphate kinase [Hyphomonadaceae bacterium]|jgi:thiamine-monophosphate kinase|nr:thiamine-phosphate kinase [Hyphomonadaceae bacterium]
MDEFDLIRRYFAPLATSPGADLLRDDVAEIAPGLIATKDAIVEGIHFLPDDPIATVAQKLVRVNVSDIIAKGGKPDAALLALIWPKSRPHDQLGDFSRALGKDLDRWGAHLAGGDTTSTDGPLTLTLTLLGKVGPRGPVRRSGAKPGDDIWVTGTIGDSWLGLKAVTGGFGDLIAEARNLLVSKYRVPEPPRLPLADLVAAHGHGSIDISDGLVADARHVAEASGAALIIEAAKVPLSATAQTYLVNSKTELRDLLTGGDDYQTLFTAPRSARPAIEASGLVTRIGRVEQGAGVKVLDTTDKPLNFEGFGGWRHFGPKS